MPWAVRIIRSILRLLRTSSAAARNVADAYELGVAWSLIFEIFYYW